MHFIKVVFVIIKSHLEIYTTIWFFKYRIFSMYGFLSNVLTHSYWFYTLQFFLDMIFF